MIAEMFMSHEKLETLFGSQDVVLRLDLGLGLG